MAGYFSNHSQSRFLSNTNQTAHQSHISAAPLETTALSSPKPRLPSSKHFSTSLSTSADEERASRDKQATIALAGSLSGVHPLRNTWVTWFRQQRAPGNKITNYEEGIKRISSFSSVQSFWSLWTHLHSPSSLLPTTDYLLFHSGVRRPVWEDPLNLGGGKWILRLKKGIADRIWEDLVLAVIGDQFDDCGSADETKIDEDLSFHDGEKGIGRRIEWPEICGCTISVRQSEDIISLWNRVDGDVKVRERIRDTIRQVLHLPPTTIMEYKSNNDSMQDKSSFRNSAIDRTGLIS